MTPSPEQKRKKDLGIEMFEAMGIEVIDVTPTPESLERERQNIRTSLTYVLPAGIKDFEWEAIINNVQALISEATSNSSKIGSKLAVDESLESVLKEFDSQFGIAGKDRNSDSIGRRAGCDDCSSNIEEREEHREFVKKVFSKFEIKT